MGKKGGELKKLGFFSYDDEKFENKSGSLSVLINPEEYTHTYAINYTTSNSVPGSSGEDLKYNYSEAETLAFKLVYDATGALGSSNPCEDVTVELDKLKKLIYTYNGGIHSPNYIKISWGSMLFRCRLTSMAVNYTLFKSNGDPLRVKVDLGFKGFLDPDTRVLKEGKESSDLTHIKIVKAGDTLPMLCHSVYGDSSYYILIAQYNKLINFRYIEPGDRLIFPPLSK